MAVLVEARIGASPNSEQKRGKVFHWERRVARAGLTQVVQRQDNRGGPTVRDILWGRKNSVSVI